MYIFNNFWEYKNFKKKSGSVTYLYVKHMNNVFVSRKDTGTGGENREKYLPGLNRHQIQVEVVAISTPYSKHYTQEIPTQKNLNHD